MNEIPMIQIPLFFSDASVMVTNVVVPMTFFLLIPLLRCEIVTNMVKCKYERSCFPNDSFNDKDCMSYTNSRKLLVLIMCSSQV